MSDICEHIYGINLFLLGAAIHDIMNNHDLKTLGFSQDEIEVILEDTWEELMRIKELGVGTDGRSGIGYLGVTVPETDKGFTVTKSIEDSFLTLLNRAPPALLKVIAMANNGVLPEARFHYLQGYC